MSKEPKEMHVLTVLDAKKLNDISQEANKYLKIIFVVKETLLLLLLLLLGTKQNTTER